MQRSSTSSNLVSLFILYLSNDLRSFILDINRDTIHQQIFFSFQNGRVYRLKYPRILAIQNQKLFIIRRNVSSDQLT